MQVNEASALYGLRPATLVGYLILPAFFSLAHRARCAAAILSLPSLEILGRLLFLTPVPSLAAASAV
jgi:hypothetical protein